MPRLRLGRVADEACAAASARSRPSSRRVTHGASRWSPAGPRGSGRLSRRFRPSASSAVELARRGRRSGSRGRPPPGRRRPPASPAPDRPSPMPGSSDPTRRRTSSSEDREDEDRRRSLHGSNRHTTLPSHFGYPRCAVTSIINNNNIVNIATAARRRARPPAAVVRRVGLDRPVRPPGSPPGDDVVPLAPASLAIVRREAGPGPGSPLDEAAEPPGSG